MFVQGTRLVDFTVVQERFTKMLPVGSRILDFGCGTGDVLFQCYEFGNMDSGLGIDLSETGINFANQSKS